MRHLTPYVYGSDLLFLRKDGKIRHYGAHHVERAAATMRTAARRPSARGRAGRRQTAHPPADTRPEP
ncbi:hypothetical protein Slala02_48750 [Streptomyces lavendulae subsp. lavendulae]|nr:hypothetical protein Slala01_52820 [Streptomyces lavendulae subsp. lavendulae]GLX29055.1 hypothetical protein Slala02_48750 [Streptomyces lavendulae subsp. lavendulae]